MSQELSNFYKDAAEKALDFWNRIDKKIIDKRILEINCLDFSGKFGKGEFGTTLRRSAYMKRKKYLEEVGNPTINSDLPKFDLMVGYSAMKYFFSDDEEEKKIWKNIFIACLYQSSFKPPQMQKPILPVACIEIFEEELDQVLPSTSL